MAAHASVEAERVILRGFSRRDRFLRDEAKARHPRGPSSMSGRVLAELHGPQLGVLALVCKELGMRA